MRVRLILAFVAMAFAGCQSPDEQRAQDASSDSAQCQSLGFTPGTDAMARCMSSAAATRSADKDRAAFEDAQRRQQQAQQQQQADAQKAQDDAWAQKNRDDFDRNFRQLSAEADAIGRPSSDDGFNPPTASRIPGMVCDGTGADAACDAR